MWGVEDNLEHINKQLFHKIPKRGAGSCCWLPGGSTVLFGVRSQYGPEGLGQAFGTFVQSFQLEDWHLVDHDGTGLIPGGNTCLFFDVENLAAAQPVERFL